MSIIEKKMRTALKDMYFDYKYFQFNKKDSKKAEELFHDYYNCMRFYCDAFGYDVAKKSESLERKWDVYWRKHQ